MCSRGLEEEVTWSDVDRISLAFSFFTSLNDSRLITNGIHLKLAIKRKRVTNWWQRRLCSRRKLTVVVKFSLLVRSFYRRLECLDVPLNAFLLLAVFMISFLFLSLMWLPDGKRRHVHTKSFRGSFKLPRFSHPRDGCENIFLFNLSSPLFICINLTEIFYLIFFPFHCFSTKHALKYSQI